MAASEPNGETGCIWDFRCFYIFNFASVLNCSLGCKLNQKCFDYDNHKHSAINCYLEDQDLQLIFKVAFKENFKKFKIKISRKKWS